LPKSKSYICKAREGYIMGIGPLSSV